MTLDYHQVFEVPESATRRDVFRWWEARRGKYNLLLLAIGAIAWVLVIVFGTLAVKPGVDFEEPLAMIAGPPIYVLFANIFFTAGPLFDLLFFSGRPRLGLFKAGLYFSIGLTATPGLWAVIAWLITVYTGKKLD